MEATKFFSYRIENGINKTPTEDGTGSIITGKTSFTHSGAANRLAIVHDSSRNIPKRRVSRDTKPNDQHRICMRGGYQ
jgi:hypothetical protein